MNKFSIGLILLGVSFSSCQKLLDYYNNHNGKEAPKCRVATITTPSEGGYVLYTANISYNEEGQPELVTEHYIDEFGTDIEDINPYEYDDQNRLLHEGPASTMNPRFRHYEYEGNSRLPARVTERVIADEYVDELGYDEKGRVIQVLRRHTRAGGGGEPSEPDILVKFYYDLQGNRQQDPSNPGYQGLIEYSDKPSLYSLNKVWQIQYKNFSRNATLYGETFNDQGLPLTTKRNYDGYFQSFLGMWNGSTITYECEGD